MGIDIHDRLSRTGPCDARQELPSNIHAFLGSPEEVVPKDHPIRRVKQLADAALREMESVFNAMYGESGRPSVPPERLLKASLLMALYTVRSERMFCDQLGYNLLFRWFLDMGMAEAPFDHSTFSKNRQRLIEHDVALQFFIEIVEQARALGLMSAEHFTVDGTLIESWASMKSLLDVVLARPARTLARMLPRDDATVLSSRPEAQRSCEVEGQQAA